MKKIGLLYVFCVAVGWLAIECHAAQEVYKVHPVPGKSTWMTLRNIGIIFDEITPIPLFNSDIMAGVLTISVPGNYQLTEDLNNCCLVIAADGVSVDLKHYKIINTGLSPAVVVVGRSQVRVCNGFIVGGGSNNGVEVQPGSTKIFLENLTLSNCYRGISFSGHGSRLTGLAMTSCIYGMLLDQANSNIIKDCKTLSCSESGFELLSSEMNCFYDCSALKTIGSGPVAGFKTAQGTNNLFQNCVAKQTKTSSTTQGVAASGFLLTGTEQKTKLIGCLVSDTSVINSDRAVTRGICEEPVLLGDEGLLSMLTTRAIGAQIDGISWSPNNNFVALSSRSSGVVYVYGFNGLALIPVTSLSLSSPSRAEWSPDGRFLVVVENGIALQLLKVYSFDGTALSLVATSVPLSGAGFSPRWSPNGKYIAVGDSGSVPANIRNYTFDGSSLVQLSVVAIPSFGTGYPIRCAWSPDGSALAASADGVAALRVIPCVSGSFGLGASLATTGSISDCSWSPCGRYIIVGDLIAHVVRIVRWLPVDVNPLLQVAQTPFFSLPGDIRFVQWAPTGNYFVCGTDSGVVKIFQFYNTAVTEIKVVSLPLDFFDAAWSADGRYILVGTDDNQVHTFRAMYGPLHCLVDMCKVVNTQADGQNMGQGFVGAGTSVFTRNVASNNGVNYGYGIPNVYDGAFELPASRNAVEPFGNISLPTVI